MDKIKGNDIGGAVKALKAMSQDIEDMRTIINQSIDAMTSIYANQVAIAAHLKVELPDPKISFDVDEERLRTKIEEDEKDE